MPDVNYLDLLQIKNYLSLLKRIEGKYPAFETIQINNFEIELIAGPGAFSSPIVELSNLLYYDSIQVAIYELIKHEREAIMPLSDKRFSHLNWSNFFIYYGIKGKENSYMGSRIPLNDVCQVIREVYKISRLKVFF